MKTTFLTLTFLMVTSVAFAAEALLMVAPRITTPELKIGYAEELSNFFGTTTFFIKSPMLAERATKRLKAPPPKITVDAEQIPKTSIVKVTVTGGTEDQNKEYLDILLEEFFKFRAELRQDTYKRKIEQLEAGISATKNKEVQEQLRQTLISVQAAHALDTEETLKRIR
jgi:hypothetical protein